MVDTGLADVVLPEVPAMRLEIDEHAQHKDVYEHSLTVMEQAIGRETGRARTSSCAWPRCCTTSASRRRARSSRGRG